MSKPRRRRRRQNGTADHVPNDERLFRLSTVAARADSSLRTVQRHVEKGALPIVRYGPHGKPRVRESDMIKYLGLDKK